MSIDTRTIIRAAIGSVSLEGLETRQHMSANPAGISFDGHTLTITGTPHADRIHIASTEAGRKVRVSLNGQLSRAFDGRQLWVVNVDAGNGDNRVTADPEMTANVNVTTGKGDDTITTAQGNDAIYSGGGADRVETGAGNDVVWAGSGNDTLNGGAGNDMLVAESGNDVVNTGGAGVNQVYAGAGVNKLIALTGDAIDNGAGQGGTSQIVLDGAAVPDPTPTPTPDPTPAPTPTPVPVTLSTIQSLSLINADTGKVISGYEKLTGTVAIDLAKLPAHFTVLANVNGTQVGSAKFELAGSGWVSHVENSEPMTLTDSIASGGFKAWSPSVGSYTLKVTPYSADDAAGTMGTATTIQFTITNSTPVQQQSNSGEVVVPVVVPPVVPPVWTGAPQIATSALQGLTITAGHAFHIQATGTVVPGADVEDASFAWDFGDAGSKWNQLPGFNAAHVYDRAGTYTVRLTVTAPNGSSSTSAINVTVNAAASTKTLYVASNGNDSADGSGPDSALRTLSRAVSLASEDTTIVLRRGDTFWQSSTVELNKNGLTISTYGVGNAPVLMWTGARDRSNVLWVKTTTSNVTIRGLTFDSVFNGDTEQTGMPISILAGGRDVTVRDNTFLNVGYCINANQLPTGLLVQDNKAPSEVGVRDYFCWTQGSDIVIVGNEVANSTREHIVRVGGADRVMIAYNKLSNLDRTAVGDKSDNAKGAIACQKGSFAYIADNQLRGPAGIGPLGGAPGSAEPWVRFEHARVDSNVTYDGTFFVQHGADHVTIVHNTVFMNDGTAFDIVGWNASYGRGNTDVVIDNNVAVNNGTLGHGSFLVVESTAQGITLTDNVYVAPYLAPGSYGASAVFVNASDLSSFTRIDGNTWPSTNRASSYVGSVMNFLGTSYDPAGHKTAAAWNALPQVGDDQFADVTLDTALRLAA